MKGFIFTQVIERPKRKVMIKRAKTATEYFKYVEEVGCEVWGVLMSIKEALYEPIGIWLPKDYVIEGTSVYVQGVELPLDYDNIVPDGYELIELPESSVMIFQGQPFDDDQFGEVIGHMMDAVNRYQPEIYGYEFDLSQPRFQLEPKGERGYIEGRPVKKL
jgi:hypothetical protein